MNKKADRKNETNNCPRWARRLITAARASVIAHVAVFAAVNALFVAANLSAGHALVEWPVALWTGVLVGHAAAVTLAVEASRLRFWFHKLELSFPVR